MNYSFPMLAQTNVETLDTSWRLQTYWTWAPWFTVLFIAAVFAFVSYCYVREVSPAGRAYRSMLALLRLGAIALVMIMLSELLLSKTRSGRPRLAILIDRSASMGIVDSVAEPEVPAELTARIASLKLGEANRLNLAKAILLNKSTPLSELDRDYEVNLYSFAEGHETLAEDELRELTASGVGAQATRLGEALAQVSAEQPGTPLAAVVLLTDGRNTTGRSLAEGAAALRRAGAPLYAMGIGAERAPPDLAIIDLRAEDAAFVDDLLSFSARVRSRGMAGERVRVELRREGASQPLATEELTIPASGEPVEVRLLDRPAEAGDITYTLSVTPLASELESKNNSVQHVVKVHDQKIRVLLASGYPNYEFRYLKNLLDRDRAVESRTFLQEADSDYYAQDRTAVSQFPVQLREMEEYDVIFLMDVDPRLLPRSTWANLKEFVTEKGGGLVFVAGPKYFPALYRDIPEIAQLSPLRMDGVDARSAGTIDPGFAFQPTPLGMRMPALQIGDTPAETESIWRGLPEQYWFAEFGPPKPAAQIIAQHPRLTTTDGKPVPLAATQFVGAGQVLLHAIDSTWKWRARVGDVFFARYWVQSLRALARAKLRNSGSGVEILADRQTYELGDAVRMQVKFRDPRLAPASDEPVTILLQSPGQPDRLVQVPRDAETPGVYRTELAELGIGRYRIVLTQPQVDPAPATPSLEIVAPPGEFADLQLDRAGLTNAAQTTRGKYFSLSDANRLFEDLPRGRRVALETLPPIELWNRWWMLLAVSTCLISEWILRKRKAML